MDIHWKSYIVAAQLLILMTALGYTQHMTSPGKLSLSAEYRVTSYGSSVQLDCLALRLNSSITYPALQLSPLIHFEISSSSEKAADSTAGIEDSLLPEVNSDMVFIHWILPDLTTLANDSMKLGDTELMTGKDGSVSLRINNLMPEHHGTYLCHALKRSTNQHVYSRSHVHFKSPPIWEEYRSNFIQAFIASGSTLVLTSLLCVVHGMRWRPKQDGDDEESGENEGGEQQQQQQPKQQQQQQQLEQQTSEKQAPEQVKESRQSILSSGGSSKQNIEGKDEENERKLKKEEEGDEVGVMGRGGATSDGSTFM